MYTRKFCLAMIKVSFGGRVAEELFCGDISSGASGDIHQATEIARRMVMDWGMSEKLGFIHYGNESMPAWFGDASLGREYSDNTAEIIDTEIKAIMDHAYMEVKELLLQHKQQMEDIKDALLKYETLDNEEVKLIIDGKKLDKPTVADLLNAEQEKSAEKPVEEETKEEEESLPAQDGIGPEPQPGMG